MQRSERAYAQLMDNFTRWALREKNIRAVAVIGSRARVDHPADEWSDLDVLIIARDPARYRRSIEWVSHVGNPWLTFIEPTAVEGRWVRHVLFEEGLDVDFAFLSVDSLRRMAAGSMPTDVTDTLRRGTHIVLDKDGLVALLQTSAIVSQVTRPLSQAAFLEVVNDFWYYAVWTAKHLRRRELWWAKRGCDGRLKERLQQMMEWHACVMKGQTHDIWFQGRFLEEWVDSRALEALRGAFAHYEEEDLWRALFVTMDLFRWLAVETANQLHYSYPALGDERVTKLVNYLFSEK